MNIENNSSIKTINNKKSKSIGIYIFKSLTIGILFFLLLNIVYGLISFRNLINYKEPNIYMSKKVYSTSNKKVVVYKNFIYKIVIISDKNERVVEIKLWLIKDLE